ncbi:MAG: ferric reductase-like transmembrane domain-containing protein [Pseudomonadota bacterium]
MPKPSGRAALIWAALVIALLVPIVEAAFSPLLAWREPVYIAAGFAGVIAMGLLLLQPLLAAGLLPELPLRRSRRLHGWLGGCLVFAVLLHVVGLWLTSPPDVIDALLFRSPTPFSVWGVIAMWAVFAAALLALLRRRLRLKPSLWRLMHATLVTVVVLGSVIHAILIDGTMGQTSKVALCALVLAVGAKVIIGLQPWKLLPRRKA